MTGRGKTAIVWPAEEHRPLPRRVSSRDPWNGSPIRATAISKLVLTAIRPNVFILISLFFLFRFPHLLVFPTTKTIAKFDYTRSFLSNKNRLDRFELQFSSEFFFFPFSSCSQWSLERTAVSPRLRILHGWQQRGSFGKMVTAGQFRRSLEMRGALLEGRHEVRMPGHRHCTHQRSVRGYRSCT